MLSNLIGKLTAKTAYNVMETILSMYSFDV